MRNSTDKSASSTQGNYTHSIKGEASYWNSLSRARVYVCVRGIVNVQV